ncbi:MAG: N-6 DNA methylase [Chloroflexota bacterium]|nr:N-6 DNA methylase [Chloroflexota bacterium]
MKGVIAVNEPKRVACGAPDFAILRGTGGSAQTVGYVEAKDPAVQLLAIHRDSERARPATENGKQLKRYRAGIQNLLFTNSLEFRWYVDGRLRTTTNFGSLVRDTVRVDTLSSEALLGQLQGFLSYDPPPVSNPRDLADRMARIAHLIRDLVMTAFATEQESDTLKDMYRAFVEVLLPALPKEQFADMFAQTLTYGLFAARVNHDKPARFRRQDAATEIPKTNPFLRRFFGAITGVALDDEPYAGFVDDLVQLLANTDMHAVLADFGKRTRQLDPVVHFYETFLRVYDPELRELRGVYFTPEPVVAYIVRSIDDLLRTRFASGGLADTARMPAAIEDGISPSHRVLVLDPACGTGTFLYAVIDLIREGMAANAGKWSGYVRDHLLPRINGFELLMALYAVAHLKLGMQLAALDLPEASRAAWAYDFASHERLGVFLTNTLEEAAQRSDLLMGAFISDEANAAGQLKRDLPIMVVLGNPPYSGESANPSTRKEKVKKGQRYRRRMGGRWDWATAKSDLVATVPTFIGQLLDDYHHVRGKPLGERNPKWLQDDYVKFIRFGQWRIDKTGAGVLAFVTNTVTWTTQRFAACGAP